MKKEVRCAVVVALLVMGLCMVTIVGANTPLLINGAGATFPYPIYSKWFSEYAKVDKAVNFNYQSIGSGGGIKQITKKIVDFGASDAPMNEEELKQVQGEIIHLPTVLGGVVLAYNIPGVNAKLNFTQKTLSDIFLGKIKRWDDEALVKANPTLKLPAKPIIVVHRADGAGTTYVFTDFLSKVSPAWLKQVGRGKSVKWPIGLGGKGNEGVTAMVKQMPYTIGYLEFSYAVHNQLSYGRVENAEGAFIDCTSESVTASAAASALTIPSDYRVSITNAVGQGSYPIASFTWLLVYRHQNNPIKGKALIGFLKWMLHDGQKFAGPLGYAPLPPALIKQEEMTVKQLAIAGGIMK